MPHEVESAERTTVSQEPAERAALESTVSSSLADIFKDGDDELVDPSPARKEPPKEEPTAEPEPKPTGEKEPEPKEEPAKAAASEQEKETPTPTPTASPAEMVLPAAYKRSLKAFQWTDDEIANGMKSNPEAFLRMAEKTHTSRVAQTQQWAEMGRKAQQAEAAVPPPAAKPKVDFTAMRQKYGNEPFIDAMEAQQAQLESAQAFVQQSQARQQEQEQETLRKSVDGFFTSADLKEYAKSYGKGALTPEQNGERQKVVQHAALLISGARVQGQAMTLEDALTMAHDAVSSPVVAKQAVAKVREQVQQRQAALSLRPGSRASAQPAATRKDLEGKVKEGLSKIFK